MSIVQDTPIYRFGDFSLDITKREKSRQEQPVLEILHTDRPLHQMSEEWEKQVYESECQYHGQERRQKRLARKLADELPAGRTDDSPQPTSRARLMDRATSRFV